ncbi:MAG: barstar family protein [Clostridiales bacterium]|nr:barstar family protein [Clostridiales bacterium]
MTEFVIDLKDVYSTDELHKKIARTLPVPEYYGANLDALYDVLTEQSEGWVIVFSSASVPETTMGKYMQKLRRMCAAATEENEGLLRVVFEE